MSEVSERIELLITRYLDGAIKPDEQVELDEALRNDPAARSMLADYQRIDQWAVEALRSSVNPARELSPSPVRLGRSRWAGWMWYVPGAIAASLAAVLWIAQPRQGSQVVDVSTPNRSVELPVNRNAAMPANQGRIMPAAHQLGFEDHALDRDAIWYVAPDGRIFLIERQLAHVSKRPSAESQVWLAAGGI